MNPPLTNPHYSISDFGHLKEYQAKHLDKPKHAINCVFFKAKNGSIDFMSPEHVDMAVLSMMNHMDNLDHMPEMISEIYEILRCGRKLCVLLPNNELSIKVVDRIEDAGFIKKHTFIIPVHTIINKKLSDYTVQGDFAYLHVFQKSHDINLLGHISFVKRAESLLSDGEVDLFFRTIWNDCHIESMENRIEIPINVFTRIIRMFSYSGDYIYYPVEDSSNFIISAIESSRSCLCIYESEESIELDKNHVQIKIENICQNHVLFEAILNPHR